MTTRDISKEADPQSRSPERNAELPDSPGGQLPKLGQFVEDASRDLDRLIVVRLNSDNDTSYFQKLFDSAGRDVPDGLREWENRINAWCDTYRTEWRMAAILEVDLRIAVYVFDQSLERVLLAYALSSPQLEARDKNRMRRFPDVNIGVQQVMGVDAFKCDRGHFLGHAAGGELDINLFPHRRDLNRGWSQEGKLFRRMEQHAATHPGTFVYHRAMYNDDTWIPDKLEYGLLVDDSKWWIETFNNKNA